MRKGHVKQSVQKFLPNAFFCFVTTWGNGPGATNEVAQFIVCCATLVRSVGLLFFNAVLDFLGPCLFQCLVRNSSF